jgi:hypothetical protein
MTSGIRATELARPAARLAVALRRVASALCQG